MQNIREWIKITEDTDIFMPVKQTKGRIRGCGSELAPPFCWRKERSCSLDIATSSSELIPKSPTRVGFDGGFADSGTKIYRCAEMKIWRWEERESVQIDACKQRIVHPQHSRLHHEENLTRNATTNVYLHILSKMTQSKLAWYIAKRVG